MPRSAHSATLLKDGRVLIMGDWHRPWKYENNMFEEIYDPKTGKFTKIGRMNKGRRYHSTILLRDGRVLIVGGYGNTAEIFNPKTNSFKLINDTTERRSNSCSVLLDDDRVLLAGGGDGIELFNPKTEKFNIIYQDIKKRNDDTKCTLLNNGKVLIIDRSSINPHNEVFLYNPSDNSLVKGPEMTSKRDYFEMATLDDGKVILIGGTAKIDAKYRNNTIEIYDSKQNKFIKSDLKLNKARNPWTVVKLKNSNLFVVGGTNEFREYETSAEIFDVKANKFIETKTKSINGYTQGVLLNNGDVLLVGGFSRKKHQGLDNAQIYKGE